MRDSELLDENKGIPLRWLIASVGAGLSCIGASFFLAFSVGSTSAKFVNANDFEDYKKVGRDHYTELVQRLTAVETGQKVIEKQNDRILDLLEAHKR